MIKFSNKTFYKRHNLELQKFVVNKNAIHIFPKYSKSKISDSQSTKLEIDPYEFVDTLNSINTKFDVVILTDIIETTSDISKLLFCVTNILNENGKIIVSSINPKYLLIIKLLEFLRLKDKSRNLSYIHNKKFNQIANVYNLEFIYSYSRQFLPFQLFFIGNFINNFFETFFFFLNMGIKTYTVLRFESKNQIKNFKKSIIIPAKNEEENLKILIDRLPSKTSYEIIISCGKSTDKTYEVAMNLKKSIATHEIKVIKQTKNGKANAVWEALEIVSGDLIAILDADMSVDPEKIESFFQIIETNKADFVNGTRLIYEMEDGAMRILNKFGNRFFQFIISKVINVPLTDSLCGTKVFKKSLIKNIQWWQKTNKLYDPFGDFDLIFTAAVTGEKISELPIHYKSRVHGVTQISRFKDGFKLIKYMVKCYLIFTTSKN